jgi:DnaJ-class molecular chaperone
LARRKFDEAKIALDILMDETIRRQYDLKKFTSVLDLLKNRPQATRAGY